MGFKNFEIRINERRILKAMASYAGFKEEEFDDVFISLDKMDKIGLDGVKEDLVSHGYAADVVDTYLNLFSLLDGKKDVADALEVLLSKLDDEVSKDAATSLEEIAVAVNANKAADFELVFDPTLVRGMSYYTGTIFEIAIPEFGGSCGGGGRYDKMVGKFIGNDVPACGFSIGFERIIMLLLENGFKVPGADKKTAYLIEKGMSKERVSDIMKEAQAARANGQTILVAMMNKNKKFQKDQLTAEGYTEFKDFYQDSLK